MKFDKSQAEEKVRIFSDHMLKRLVEHEDRGDWSDRPILSFYAKIVEKSIEVFEAIQAGDFDKVSKKCADGANFYLMLADRVGSLNPEG